MNPRRGRFSPALLLPGAMLVALAAPQAEATGRAAPQLPACQATGSEYLAPALDNAAACARFLAALDAALADLGSSPAARAGLSVALTFSRNGFGRADLSRDGGAESLGRMGVASMDRPLDTAAIDRLAAVVARSLVQE
ncbi:MAG: hypothetical protein KDE15_10680 [Erythrobacter sp.]|nr:hypothetical protein [Erythrobacter sp.]